MRTAARYALYYMPDPRSALWAAASKWLGRDALSGEQCPHPELPGAVDLDARAFTAGPRHYGFHGTLRAPFEPRDDCDEGALVAALETFAAARATFECRLEVATISEFVALRLATPSAAMGDLHRDCLECFDRFRRPISSADLARRRRVPLTPEQDAHLERWGYPYVLDQFRFHMTLTQRIADDALRATLVAALAAYLAPALGASHRAQGIGLFAQRERSEPFEVLRWCPFGDGAVDPASASLAADVPG